LRLLCDPCGKILTAKGAKGAQRAQGKTHLEKPQKYATLYRMSKILLSGNEAIARGAYEAGVTLAAGYPGTPSTEILQNIAMPVFATDSTDIFLSSTKPAENCALMICPIRE
jgi:hypothetical protein